MKRLILSTLLAIAAVVAGFGVTGARHAYAWQLSYAENPPCKVFCFGLQAWFEWDKASNEVVDQTPYFGKEAYYKLPNSEYSVTQSPLDNGTGYDVGGNYFISFGVDYTITISRPGYTAIRFNCYPRLIAYSFGGTYSYWGPATPIPGAPTLATIRTGMKTAIAGRPGTRAPCRGTYHSIATDWSDTSTTVSARNTSRAPRALGSTSRASSFLLPATTGLKTR